MVKVREEARGEFREEELGERLVEGALGKGLVEGALGSRGERTGFADLKGDRALQ